MASCKVSLVTITASVYFVMKGYSFTAPGPYVCAYVYYVYLYCS